MYTINKNKLLFIKITKCQIENKKLKKCFFKADFRNCLFALDKNHVGQDRSDMLCNVNVKYCQNRQDTRKQLLF